LYHRSSVCPTDQKLGFPVNFQVFNHNYKFYTECE
jgi:hypothetical protein